jgi:hypothetical protein
VTLNDMLFLHAGFGDETKEERYRTLFFELGFIPRWKFSVDGFDWEQFLFYLISIVPV